VVAEGGNEFAADSGNGLQQKLGEIAEGDGLLLGDASLSHEEKNLGESAVDVGGGGEIAAEGFEPWEGGVRGAAGAGIAFLFGGVVSAKLG
jgi:hypothetical protein